MYRRHTDKSNNAISTDRPDKMVERVTMPVVFALPAVDFPMCGAPRDGSQIDSRYLPGKRHQADFIDIEDCSNRQHVLSLDISRTLRTSRAGPGRH
jgi:hypothetical protein